MQIHSIPDAPTPALPAATETAVESAWTGGPSQRCNAGRIALCVLLALACLYLVAAFHAPAWAYPAVLLPWAIAVSVMVVRTACVSYTFDHNHLRVSGGVLSRTLDDIELYRVFDYRAQRPLGLRMVSFGRGLGNLVVLSGDKTSPAQILHAIPNVDAVYDSFAACVEDCRQRRGTRVLDVDSHA